MPSIDVLDSTIHYEDHGSGATVVFLHGNPSSSHMWRTILPLAGAGRLIAPDLIGMGRSGKPVGDYRFADHARYLDAFFDALGLDDIVLVGHDWGGALAFDWAARNPGRVRGVAFFETIVRPIDSSELSEQARAHTARFRTAEGEALVLDTHFFVEAAYTGGVLNPLGAEDLDAYRLPYPTRDSRRPLLNWTRSLPIDGDPADVTARISAYGAWLADSRDVPKLLLTFDSSPTLLITAEVAAWCKDNVAGLRVEHCGPAGHHAAEDQPEAIAAAIATWLDQQGLR
ncbi:haloalkane dehalogenase [Nonomuraea soli]|uniref:Haloalkane dehalogenase n=1 Tax=Nonomuraea soli TaxID=1032476 RepID=A0A7W0CHE5_9ACTN|nr:haloalkane dehalogenase [Nonomuraea soli]MBA2891199.1 haloalkane dehalogenase [Nonomuraea soli]